MEVLELEVNEVQEDSDELEVEENEDVEEVL
jgi:hypothetical protein